MRFLAPFLAFVVLFLSLIPCSDEIGIDEKAGIETHADHDHSGGHREECTPFCTCSCCSTNIVFSSETILIAEIPELLPSNLFFYQESKSHFTHSIWQPPKI
jgi:hypothetical protein